VRIYSARALSLVAGDDEGVLIRFKREVGTVMRSTKGVGAGQSVIRDASEIGSGAGPRRSWRVRGELGMNGEEMVDEGEE
jgi:hypothetical protein